MTRVRKSIEEIIERSNQTDAKGLKCSHCGCVQFRDGRSVRNTIPMNESVKRYRECRACGRIFTTVER
jgi:hypothetical protein